MPCGGGIPCGNPTPIAPEDGGGGIPGMEASGPGMMTSCMEVGGGGGGGGGPPWKGDIIVFGMGAPFSKTGSWN